MAAARHARKPNTANSVPTDTSINPHPSAIPIRPRLDGEWRYPQDLLALCILFYVFSAS